MGQCVKGLKLQEKPDTLLLHWMKVGQNKFTSHVIQDEILQVIANQIICVEVSDIHKSLNSIIFDEYKNASNQEQLPFFPEIFKKSKIQLLRR